MDVIPSRDWHFVTIFMICLSKLYCKKKALGCGLLMHRPIGGQYNASADVLGRAAGEAPAGWLIAGRVISGALYTATPATDQLAASQA